MRFRLPLTVALAVVLSAGPLVAQSFEWRAGQDGARDSARVERLAQRLERAAHDRAIRASRAAERARDRIDRAVERMVDRIERRAMRATQRLESHLERHGVWRPHRD